MIYADDKGVILGSICEAEDEVQFHRSIVILLETIRVVIEI